MSQRSYLKDAAQDIFAVYGVFCLFAFCAVLAYAGDRYEVWDLSPQAPNDAPFVVSVSEGVEGVFEGVESVVEEVGELVKEVGR